MSFREAYLVSWTPYSGQLLIKFLIVRIPTTRIMVYKGHREMSILVAPLFLPKKPYCWPQGGPYFKTSSCQIVMEYEAGLVFHSTVLHLNTNKMWSPSLFIDFQ